MTLHYAQAALSLSVTSIKYSPLILLTEWHERAMLELYDDQEPGADRPGDQPV